MKVFKTLSWLNEETSVYELQIYFVDEKGNPVEASEEEVAKYRTMLFMALGSVEIYGEDKYQKEIM